MATARNARASRLSRRTRSVSLSEPSKRSAQSLKTFRDYQKIVERTDEKKQRIISLLGLVGEVGDLHSMVKKLMLQKENPTFRADLREEFGDVLWYLTSLASLYKISLEEVARANADKVESLFLEGTVATFDKSFPADERFPRQFRVSFRERPLDKGVYVKTTINGIGIGDALTDNARQDDGYRYHDVFHFAYAAVLGWSPVVRSLLRRKRKSDPKVDEVEDGARAAVVEEAISIFVFNQAVDRGWYRDESSMDIGLLKTIRRMTVGLEVNSCTAKQWKKAIILGFSAFSKLREHNGGDIDVNLDAQSLVYVGGPSKDDYP